MKTSGIIAKSLSGPLADALGACQRHFAYALGFSAALNLLYLAPSLYMMQVYDRVLVSGGMMTLIFLSIALLLSLATLGFLDTLRARLMVAASRRLERLLSRELLGLAFRAPERSQPGAPSRSQLMRDFDTIRAAITGPTANAVFDLPWAPVFVIVCFLIHPVIGLLVVFGAAALTAAAWANERALRKAIEQQTSAVASYAVQDADSGGSEAARVMGMGPRLVDRQIISRGKLVDAQSQAAMTASAFTSGVKFLRLVLQSMVLGVGAWLAVSQQISPGGIIASSILAARAFAPFEQIVAAWRQFGQAQQSLKTVDSALAAEASRPERTRLPDPRGAIQVEGVSIAIPNTQTVVLAQVSFALQAGEILGVIGPSGAGKTTLIRAIAGAVRPGAGAIRIDGASLTDWDPIQLGPHMGYVPQSVSLFSGTVGENISRFQTGDKEEIHARTVIAAQAADVHQLILRLPEAYDTKLGPDGRGLSAGQAQRVALARALYGDPAILILDEPNSNLDAEGEAALIQAMKAAKARGATIIVVAHRAGFLSIADKLLVLNKGRVESFGPREQVAARLSAVEGGKTAAPAQEASRGAP